MTSTLPGYGGNKIRKATHLGRGPRVGTFRRGAASESRVMRHWLAVVVGLVLLLTQAGCRFLAEVKKMREELIEASEARLRLTVGPETDSWPEQPVDAETKALLDLGLQTARAPQALGLRGGGRPRGS